jgi:predicted hydrolase (HD superfamily)
LIKAPAQNAVIHINLSCIKPMSRISWEEALKLIEGSSKYEHSVLASRIMKALTDIFHEDLGEWGLVGLLHDLDYDEVSGDMSRHGIVAAKMLEGRLSEGALHAIMAHDHRTGVRPESLLDESLIYADSLAVLMEDQALDASADAPTLDRALRDESEEKPWIRDNILSYSERRRVSVSQILRRLRSLRA